MEVLRVSVVYWSSAPNWLFSRHDPVALGPKNTSTPNPDFVTSQPAPGTNGGAVAKEMTANEV